MNATLAKAKALAVAIEALSTEPVQALACRELLTLLENVSTAAVGARKEDDHGPAAERPQRRDPELARTTHEHFDNLTPAATTSVAAGRPLSMTPNAIRARDRRAAARASQLALFDDPPSVATAVDRLGSARTFVQTPVATTVARPPSTTTDHINTISSQKTRARTTAVATVHDADHPPAWAFDAWRLFRPDMSEHHFRQMWWKFVKENPTHASEARAEAHLARWLERERVKDIAPVVESAPPVVEESAPAAPTFDEDELPPLDAPEDPPAPPESIQRPITTRLEATRQRLALLALEDADELARAPPHAASA